MWKIIVFPQWNYEYAEKKLEQMERLGYRLEYMCLCWLFIFRKSSPRNVRYIFTYSLPKECGMLDCEYELRRRCKANKVPASCCFFSQIYRITDLEQDVQMILNFRSRYLIRALLQKIFLTGFYGMLAVIGYVDSLCKKTPPTLFCLVGVLAFFLALYYLTGIIWIKRRSAR